MAKNILLTCINNYYKAFSSGRGNHFYDDLNALCHGKKSLKDTKMFC